MKTDTLYMDVISIIKNLDAVNTVTHIKYLRYSNIGGSWEEKMVISYPQHIEHTLKYLDKWFRDITEITVYDLNMNKICSYEPNTIIQLTEV